MSSFKFDCNAYLQRINYDGEKTPTIDTLKALHHAHLYTIPFENFDIQLGRGIDLSPEAIFEKLVHQNRGGYCYELNGLFLMALKDFGFDARPLLGRVHITGTPTGRSHQIELITIEDRHWIADVGFGTDTPRVPMPLELERPIEYDGQKTRLVDAGHFGFMLQAEKDEEWIDNYSFDLAYVYPADFDYANYYNSTKPGSFFVSARVAMLPVKNGALTILNNRLKKKVGKEEIVQELEEGQPYLDALKNHFSIELDAPYEALRPVCHQSLWDKLA